MNISYVLPFGLLKKYTIYEFSQNTQVVIYTISVFNLNYALKTNVKCPCRAKQQVNLVMHVKYITVHNPTKKKKLVRFIVLHWEESLNGCTT